MPQELVQLSGRAIMQNPAIQNLLSQGFGLEILYSFIIILASLMIYIATKEIYNLTKHRGIKYFRQGFLFFAIAYFFRSFIKFIILYFNLTRFIELDLQEFSFLTLLAFVYFSSMAIFYLLYSVLYKKFDKPGGLKSRIYVFHILALIIAITISLSRDPLTYLIINLLFLVLILIMIYYAKSSSYKEKQKLNKSSYLYTTYILLFIFWILNILELLIPDIFRTAQLVIYLMSITIFMIILYKVLKKS